jgi:ABC-2 type transport system ATP-binding protein
MQVKTYSGGMRRRLDLAASLIAAADLYFLDEATTGLDPASRTQVHQLIRSLTAGGATVLLTTQYLEEADQLASRIAVIDHGTVVAEGTPGELKAAADTGTLRIRLADPAHRPQAMKLLTLPLGPPAPAKTDPVILTTTIPAAAAAAQRPDRIRRLQVAG